MTSCGGDDAPSQAASAGATSLQEAMDATSRATDEVRPTRASMNGLAASLERSTSQTGDVITVLMPAAAKDPALTTKLLAAAREQRNFLQSVRDVAGSRSRSEVNAALNRARTSGRAASKQYAELRTTHPEIAGLLPSATTFNVGHLADVARRTHTKTTKKKASAATTSSSTSSGSGSGTNCGDGISANANTSCPFARNVASEYSASGGSSVIDVYSPVTGQTYTMHCSGGIPTVCRGGNSAVVTIR